MNFLGISRKKELTLIVTSIISLILAFSLKRINIEYEKLPIFFLLIFYFVMSYYLTLIIIEEKKWLLKASLILYITYVFSVICRLFSYIVDDYFKLKGFAIGLANILGLFYWAAMIIVITSLFYNMKSKGVTAKILFAFCGIFLTTHVLKSTLRIDLFINATALNDNIFMFLSVLILGFTMRISKENVSYGLKGIFTILFMSSVYILIKTLMITTET